MIIKLPDGSQVELLVGSLVTLTVDAFGVGLGPFKVLSFEGELPVILLQAAQAEGEDNKVAPISVELIAFVDNPEELKVEVKLPSGQIVLVDAKIAPVLQAIVDTNTQLLDQLGRLLSGDEIRAMQAKLDLANIERDAAVAEAEQVRGALPAVQQALEAVQKAVDVLKG